MEDKLVKSAASSSPSLQVSVSFGRLENDILSWEKFFSFLTKLVLGGSWKIYNSRVCSSKEGLFRSSLQKIAERIAEIIDHHEKQMMYREVSSYL
ncbi:hypothetical protein Bca4012_055056 [Brassica carinata]